MRLNLRNKKQEGESRKLLSAQELKWRMDVAKGGRRGRGHRSGTNDLRPGIFTSANLLPVPPTTPSSRQSAHTSWVCKMIPWAEPLSFFIILIS